MEQPTHLVAILQHFSLVMHCNAPTDSSAKCGNTTVAKVNGVRVVERDCGAGHPLQLVEGVRLVLPASSSQCDENALVGAVVGAANFCPDCDSLEKILAVSGRDGWGTFHCCKGGPAHGQIEDGRCPGLRWIEQPFHSGLMMEGGTTDGIENPMEDLHGVVRPPLQHLTPWR